MAGPTGGGTDRGASPDRRLAALASRQHGIVARRQLLELGLGGDAIQHRIEGGRLFPVHRGVYAVGHRSTTQHGRWMAAVLAAGRGAVLSHRSAAALWRIARVPHVPIEVLGPRNSRRIATGLVVDRTTRIDKRHVAVHQRIPVTGVARTLLDLATRVGSQAVREAFDEADRRGLLNRSQLDDLCARTSGRRGTGTLRSLLAAPSLPLSETRSELERRFLRFCRGRGLPIPAVNVPFAGYEVDCLWPEQRVVVELDSWAYHGDHESFERDRRRDARIQLLDHRVVRVTKLRLTDGADELEAELRGMLGLGGPQRARAG